MKKYIIDREISLIDYLTNNLKYSHKEAKKILANKQIVINGKTSTKYNYQLKVNDNLIINQFYVQIGENIKIIYEDKNIIVVNKPNNILTIATKEENVKTVYHLVSNYLNVSLISNISF